MGLRDELPADASVGEFEVAGMDRLRDGLALARQGRKAGAVYLLGYAAEITLKCMYYRAWGYRSSDRVDRSTLRTTASLGNRELGVTVNHEGYHSPLFWAHMVVEIHRAFDTPLNPGLSRALIAVAQRVSSNWSPTMRYIRDRVTVAYVRSVVADTLWINNCCHQLRR